MKKISLSKKWIVFIILLVTLSQINAVVDPGVCWVIDQSNDIAYKLSHEGGELLKIKLKKDPSYTQSQIKSIQANAYDGSVLINKVDYVEKYDSVNMQLIKLNPYGETIYHKQNLYGTVYGTAAGSNGRYYYLFNHVMARGHYQLDKINQDNTVKSCYLTFYNEATNLAINQNDNSIWVTSPRLINLTSGLKEIILTRFAEDGTKLYTVEKTVLNDYLGGNHIAVNSNNGNVFITLKNVYSGLVSCIAQFNENGLLINYSNNFNQILDIATNETEETIWVLEKNSVNKLDSNFNIIFSKNSLNYPAAIQIDQANGNVWISNTNNNQVLLMDQWGNILAEINNIEKPGPIAVISSFTE